MTITKKDFVAIADIIRYTQDKINLVGGLSDYFKKVNPNFDEKKFKVACGTMLQDEELTEGIDYPTRQQESKDRMEWDKRYLE